MKMCYNCIYRGEVPGSVHSRCNHPIAEKASSPLGEVFAMLSKRGALLPAEDQITVIEAARQLGVTGDAHGIRSGWFNWPYDFDPVWLLTCSGFKSREAE